jgi:hypothetical protein
MFGVVGARKRNILSRRFSAQQPDLHLHRIVP